MRNQSIADDSSIDHRMTKLEGLVEQLNLRMWSLQGGHKEMKERMDAMGDRLEIIVEQHVDGLARKVFKKTSGQETPFDWTEVVEQAMNDAQAQVCKESADLPSEDMPLQSRDLESKLDNHGQNLPDSNSNSVTETVDSRLEGLEKRLYDLTDNQLRQQRAVEAQHTEVRLLFSRLQADTTKQQYEQLHQVQRIEEALGALKFFPDQLNTASHLEVEPCSANDQKQLNDMACSKLTPGTPLSLKATRQVSPAVAPVTSTSMSSPRGMPWQPRPGSKSVQLPSRDCAEALEPTTLLHPRKGSISPRTRSASLKPSAGARQPQQEAQQSLVPPQVKQSSTGIRRSLTPPQVKRSPPAIHRSPTAVPVTRNSFNGRAASPGSHGVQRTHGATPQQGFKAEIVALTPPVVPLLPTPQFISGRATIPVSSAFLTRKPHMNIGGA
mmetsp:Transcript_74647/g.132355  ORF Transcript_74647/g.132355 Transcript_74647/m.132355 type:complete len:439 (-) Transcript_74647:174-1490(-)